MISDLSETLRGLLSQPGLPTELSTAQIVFDRPSESFKPSQTSIDLFLFDIRENTLLRSNERYVERNNNSAILKKAPLRVDCSYLLTAWPIGGEEQSLQEHRLLSQALQILSKFPVIPGVFLKGKLKNLEPPLPMMAANPDGIQNPSEFWTALGNQLRPSISVSVTIAMDLFEPEEVPIVVTSSIKTKQINTVSGGEQFFRIAGVLTSSSNQPVEGAKVSEKESGVSVLSKSNGSYSLVLPKEGSYKIIVEKESLRKEFPITVPSISGSSYDIKIE